MRSNCKSPEKQRQQQQRSSPDFAKAQSEQLVRENGDVISLDALRSALTAQIPATGAQTLPEDPSTTKVGTTAISNSSEPSSPKPSSTSNLLNLSTLRNQKTETPCQQQQQQQQQTTALSQAQSTPVSARQTAHLLNLAPLQTLISALANASSGAGKVDATNGPITTSSGLHFLPQTSSVSAPLVAIDGPLGATCPISFPTALASALMPPQMPPNALKGVTLGEYIPVGSLISGQTTGGVFNSVALNASAPNLISFVTGLGANNQSANATSTAARFQPNFSAGSLGFGPPGDSATPMDFNAQQALLAAAAAAATAPANAQDLQSGTTPLRLSTSTTTIATPMICALDPRNTLHLRVPESITVACSGFPAAVAAAPVKGYRLESANSLDSNMREVPSSLGLDEEKRTGDFEGSSFLNIDTSQRNGSLDEGTDDSDEMADESCAGATNSGASASAGGDGESPIPSNDPSSTSGQNRNRRTPGSRPSGGGRRSGLGGSRPHRQNFTPTQNRILTEWYSSHQ
ncbi:unnamed protein product [Schistocephalus solidus]|uniref:Homeobox protein prospero n=1 Tax=Schistocephalus solidus TaxID=70667 RepID=A0A183SMV9_SCHSO|nr:unnamed protein product [Schistocephalus solidus]